MKFKIGDEVYCAGDFMDNTESVVVDNTNIDIITKYWNRCYFKTWDEAYRVEECRRMNYAEYICDSWRY